MRTELWADCGRGGGRGTPVSGIQAFDGRRQFIVRPGEIRPGDWLRDLGTLRQVVSVDDLVATSGSGRLLVVHFAQVPGVEGFVLEIPDTVTVTVWRSA